MCRRHAAPTQAQIRQVVNSLTFRAVVCQLSEVVHFLLLKPVKRCSSASSLSVFKNRLKTYFFRRCLQNSGHFNSIYYLGQFKNVCDDDDDDDDDDLARIPTRR